MEFAVALLVGNSGRVAAIWLTLILLAVFALFALALPRGVHRPRQITAWLAAATHTRMPMSFWTATAVGRIGIIGRSLS